MKNMVSGFGPLWLSPYSVVQFIGAPQVLQRLTVMAPLQTQDTSYFAKRQLWHKGENETSQSLLGWHFLLCSFFS